MTLQHRAFCFTCNNYTHQHVVHLQQLHETKVAKYIVYGREVSSTLTPHLQGFVIFNNKQSVGAAIKHLHGCHVEVRSPNATNKQAADYCKKDGDYDEFGVLNQQGKRSDLAVIANQIDNGATIEQVATAFPATYIRNYRGIANYKALKMKSYTPPALRGEWYVGPPGTGKSRKAREENPDAYLKAQNKWWDGYNEEKVVIFDDLDKGAIGLGHHLKIWTDRYACSGEIKGGTIKLQHETFIVTSNYTIEQLWADDPEMAKAIARRFKVTYFHDYF